LPQLLVDQRQELLGRLRVTLLDRGENAGHIVHSRVPPSPSLPRKRQALRLSSQSRRLRIRSPLTASPARSEILIRPKSRLSRNWRRIRRAESTLVAVRF